MSDDPLPQQDALEQLRERVRQAQEAARRVAEEAAAAAAERMPPRGFAPERGWAAPAAEDSHGPGDRELQAVLAIIELVRGLIPEDLQRQAVELVRELLLLLRALIDWWLDRLDRRRPADAAEVRDIPIS